MDEIIVSVVVPVYNEEKYIEKNILGFLHSDFPKEQLEIIYVDGVSSDLTLSIIHGYEKEYPFIRHCVNEKRYTPYALNMGLKNARGKYVIFTGAHSQFDYNYIRVLVEMIELLGADAVGGMIRTEIVHETPVSVAIKEVLQNKFGVGNAYYRTGADDIIEVDTAGFLCYNRDKLHRLGGYNEKLIRNQDIELNKRIKMNGGRIFLIPAASVTYFARETYREIAANNYNNGMWNILTVFYTKDMRSLSIRHFVPLAFVASLIIPMICSIWLPLAAWLSLCSFGAYNLLVITQSIKIKNDKTTIWSLAKAFYTLHFSYGAGSFSGILKVLKLISHGE